jgi:hypothetical protein
MVNFKRLLNTRIGIVFISILLGLGLATLFRKACKGKDCITFNGPKSTEIDGKVYHFGDDCYKYSLVTAKCDSTKKIIDFKPMDKKDGEFSQEDITAAYQTHGKYETANGSIQSKETNDFPTDASSPLGWFDQIRDFFGA